MRDSDDLKRGRIGVGLSSYGTEFYGGSKDERLELAKRAIRWNGDGKIFVFNCDMMGSEGFIRSIIRQSRAENTDDIEPTVRNLQREIVANNIIIHGLSEIRTASVREIAQTMKELSERYDHMNGCTNCIHI